MVLACSDHGEGCPRAHRPLETALEIAPTHVLVMLTIQGSKRACTRLEMCPHKATGRSESFEFNSAPRPSVAPVALQIALN